MNENIDEIINKIIKKEEMKRKKSKLYRLKVTTSFYRKGFIFKIGEEIQANEEVKKQLVDELGVCRVIEKMGE